MADIRSEIKYGTAVYRITGALADSTDAGNVPDAVPMTGTATLTGSVSTVRFPTLDPPETVIVSSIVAKIIDGVLCGPDATTSANPGVRLLASDQSSGGGEPDTIQWTAQFRLDNLTGAQPPTLRFDVPVDGTIDLSTVAPSAAPVGVQQVFVTSATAVEAATAAEAAAAASASAASTAAADTAAALADSYAAVANAQRDVRFGVPQNSAFATTSGPPINFGAVNPPPPVVATPGARGIDVLAHWYNDFGLAYRHSVTPSSPWYSWSWNFPTNTGNGQTADGHDPQRWPLQGFYQGDNPDVLGWQCKWLAECGVTALSIVQNGAGFSRGAGGTAWATATNPANWVYQLFNNVPNFQALRYLLWLADDGNTAALTAQLDEIIWAYQNYPNGYTYTESGRTHAVVYLWDGEGVRGAFDNYVGDTNTRAHFTNLASKFQAIGYDGVMVLARQATSTLVEDPTLQAAGVLYLKAEYSDSYGGSYSGSFAEYAAEAPFPSATGTVPNVLTSAFTVYPHPSNGDLEGTTPELFGKALRRACDSIVRNGQRRLVTVYNVAEWAEGGPGLIPNVADGFGYLDAVRSLPTYAANTELPDDVQVFTSSGTWVKPLHAKSVRVTCIGGGGGGAAGGTAAPGVAAPGGAGGGGGGITIAEIPASALPASLAVVVGAAGTGGASQNGNDLPVLNGTAATDTTFGSILKSVGGGRGVTNAGGGGGAAQNAGQSGGASSATGAAGTSVAAATLAPGGGGGGGGVTTANAATTGGHGGVTAMVVPFNAATATPVDTSGVTRYFSAAGAGLPGGGGSGGGGSSTGPAGSGAPGGVYGAGGGGGGGARNGHTSGAGGAGAAGICIVVTTR